MGLPIITDAFVYNFAEVAHPLTELTKKGVAWQWGPMQQRTFQLLKQRLCEAPVLLYPHPQRPYTVVTDASGTAVGGVLGPGSLFTDIIHIHRTRSNMRCHAGFIRGNIIEHGTNTVDYTLMRIHCFWIAHQGPPQVAPSRPSFTVNTPVM